MLAMTSMGIYGMIIAGWASNSKYAFIGAMRAAAQMVSYELAMGFALVGALMAGQSMRLSEIVARQDGNYGFLEWFWLPLFPLFLIHYIAGLAETNRHPFDVAEGESEIVAGFHVEYSGMMFAVFFLAEYANMILISTISSLVFMGGWLSPFDFAFVREAGAPSSWLAAPGIWWLLAKVAFLMFVFLWVRASFPRYRYDQIMRLGWKVFIPITLIWIAVVGVMMMEPFASTWPSPSGSEGSHVAASGTSSASLMLARADEGPDAHRAAHVQAQGDGDVPRGEDAARARASAACTRCAAIPTARSAASPASCARRCARRSPSPSRASSATTARAAPRATTSTW